MRAQSFASEPTLGAVLGVADPLKDRFDEFAFGPTVGERAVGPDSKGYKHLDSIFL
jgi:hypothetical protein